jgi:hypothetical protein
MEQKCAGRWRASSWVSRAAFALPLLVSPPVTRAALTSSPLPQPNRQKRSCPRPERSVRSNKLLAARAGLGTKHRDTMVCKILIALCIFTAGTWRGPSRSPTGFGSQWPSLGPHLKRGDWEISRRVRWTYWLVRFPGRAQICAHFDLGWWRVRVWRSWAAWREGMLVSLRDSLPPTPQTRALWNRWLASLER